MAQTSNEFAALDRQRLRHLHGLGWQPLVFFDVGASNGTWSRLVSEDFPEARFELFEPLVDHISAYRPLMENTLAANPRLRLHKCAVGSGTGRAPMQVFPDGFSSTSLDSGYRPEGSKTVEVETVTLDEIIARCQLPIPQVIKVDTQGGELQVLRGARHTLPQVDVLVLETWLTRGYGKSTPLLQELSDWLEEFNFFIWDLGDGWRDQDGTLVSQDVFFLNSRCSMSRLRDEPASRRAALQGQPALVGVTATAVVVPNLSPAAPSPVPPPLERRIRKAWKALWPRRERQRKEEPTVMEAAGTRVLTDADAIVTPNEVTDRHGTGVLINRIFGRSPNILSIRSASDYPDHSLGAVQLIIRHQGLSQAESSARLLQALNGTTVKRVVCVPFASDELVTALLLKQHFGAQLCTYVMDDNNVFKLGIPDDLMREALAKSDLRLAISREMLEVYERKFGFKFTLLPPIVTSGTIPTAPDLSPREHAATKTGAMVGNVWSTTWLADLRRTVRQSGLKIHWYGSLLDWLRVTPEELAEDGIIHCGFLPEAELTQRLKHYPYTIVASGTLEERDDRKEIALLSLPSRLSYLMAVCHMPVIVLGNPDTAASRFVRNLAFGRSISYDAAQLSAAVEETCQPEQQLTLRTNASKIGRLFSAEGIDAWIWKSLELGEPADNRFSELMAGEPVNIALPENTPASAPMPANWFRRVFAKQSSNAEPATAVKRLSQADAIITHDEVTDAHGTGALVKRIFGGCPNILSLRSASHYPEHALGDVQLVVSHKDLSRSESFHRLLEMLNGTTIRRLLCVPYSSDDLVSAIVLKELFNVPLCIYVMDDNNILKHGIPNELMREALDKADLRLAISRELVDEYEKKYARKFWLLPPLIEPAIAQTTIRLPAEDRLRTRTGALVGNLWSHDWLCLLRETVRRSGIRLHWFGGNAQAEWLKSSAAELEQDGITCLGFLPEPELLQRLKDYPYAVIPSGTLDARDDRPEMARLSLPSRMPYLLATTHMPLIVLGSKEAAAAKFVQRLQVGMVTDYDGELFRKAVEEVCQPDRQRALRQSAAASGRLFVAEGIADWIWNATEKGAPEDNRFEHSMPRDPGALQAYVELPAPKDLWHEFAPMYRALRRLRDRGYRPDFLLDVGASTGIWSDMAWRIFPQGRFILVDPLHKRYAKDNSYLFKKHPDFECMAVALSDHPGTACFQVSNDLYGSSLLHPSDHRSYETVEVPVTTLEALAKDKCIQGRGILKLDVQCAEHLVLAGAGSFLARVDAIQVETSLVNYAPGVKLLPEMFGLLEGFGFRYYDEAGGWRCPAEGTLLQKDVLFLRKELFPYQPA
jgi:FkbM family methyltransferase